MDMRTDSLTGPDRQAADEVGRLLRGLHPIGVAFSGGVDSSVLLALAARALGRDQVVAILGVSPSLAADERAGGARVAGFIGVAVVEVETHEGDRPAYRANGPDRCFHCKDELFTRIADEVVAAHGLDAVAYGENADDARRPDRPGARAAADHRVLRPLADAGMDKAAVRRIARALALPCADKPAAPCLASRIPHHRRSARRSCARSSGPRRPCAGWASPTCGCAITARSPASSCPPTICSRAVHRPAARRGARRRSSSGRVPVRRRRPGRHPVRRLHPAAGRGAPWLSDRPAELGGVRASWTSTARARRGYPEAVYCEGKTAEQVAAIAAAVRAAADVGHPVHPGRAGARRRRCCTELPDAYYDAEAARCSPGRRSRRNRPADWWWWSPPAPPTCRWRARRMLTAATSAAAPNWSSTSGVAGLHRILARLDLLRRARVVVVAAGMDGALPSVVAGLVSAPWSRCRPRSVTAPRSAGWRRCWRC